jgi:peptidoglycan biosynthesis protein MviN/MurJ (putative lipid II flippase)
LGLKSIGFYVCKLALATLVMTGVCLLIQKLPFFPKDPSKSTALLRLAILITSGAIAYFAICFALGVTQLRQKSLEDID